MVYVIYEIVKADNRDLYKRLPYSLVSLFEKYQRFVREDIRT